MRIAVSDTAHVSAVAALVDGNQLAAHAALKLADRLAESGGMAGDDSTAEEFAASYDEAATSTLAALESLVGAYATLGRLVQASLTNHARAEARSVIPDVPGWAQPFVGPPTPADHTVGVLLADPPSSLGSSDPGPGGLSGMVLDLLQDVFWPNADTDRVRTAATAWSTAAGILGPLTAHCDSATNALEPDRSPELPLARATITELRAHTDDLVEQMHALAAACTEYADQVDERRHELLELLGDLVKELIAGAAVAGILSTFSFGSAAGAATTIGAERLASASTKARGILDSLRIAVAGSAFKIKPVASSAAEVRLLTEKIRGARIMMLEANARALRPMSRVGERMTFLRRHEGLGRGHVLRRHVGKTPSELYWRAVNDPFTDTASAFKSEGAAADFIQATLRGKSDEVESWLSGSSAFKRIDQTFDVPTGISVDSLGEVTPVTGVRVILVRDATLPDGYWIKTAFPQPGG